MSDTGRTVATKSGWLRLDNEQHRQVEEFCIGYMAFLDRAKTEREAVRDVARRAREAGFEEIHTLSEWKAGARVYLQHRGKALILAVLGTQPPVEGLNMVAAHIDAPRLDVKPRALREDEGFGLLETQYYGGVKKYHWLSLPLALHGVVVRKDGSVVDLQLGSRPEDPVFVIPDVLPHLAQKVQMTKTVSDLVPGENLDVIVGSIPLAGVEKDAVKSHLLAFLQEHYGIEDDDFVSAELEVVPAGNSRHIGMDRSMIGAYGQDDRVCAYTGVSALFDCTGIPQRTAVMVLADKEEVGSQGTTGMEGAYIDRFVAMLLSLAKNSFTPLDLLNTWDRTRVLSADVSVGVCPIWPSIHELTNAARLGCGPVVTKYAGGRGKGGSNDASAEFMADVRRFLDDSKVIWQTGQYGKVDEGGAGTVAYALANRGADVVDMGAPLLGMHSPFEVSSKLDVYFMYRACLAFFGS